MSTVVLALVKEEQLRVRKAIQRLEVTLRAFEDEVDSTRQSIAELSHKLAVYEAFIVVHDPTDPDYVEPEERFTDE